MEPRYIGDGVTASWDGYQIWLRTEREASTHEIALESETFYNLLRYQRDLAAITKKIQEAGP